MSTPKPLLHTRARLGAGSRRNLPGPSFFIKETLQYTGPVAARGSHTRGQMRCGCPSRAGKPPVNLRLPLSYPRDPT